MLRLDNEGQRILVFPGSEPSLLAKITTGAWPATLPANLRSTHDVAWGFVPNARPEEPTFPAKPLTNGKASSLVVHLHGSHSETGWEQSEKSNRKTVQGISRHAKIQTTLDLYTQEDGDETLAAQEEYLTALGVATQLVQ